MYAFLTFTQKFFKLKLNMIKTDFPALLSDHAAALKDIESIY